MTDYPSIVTQPGAAARNMDPIAEQLRVLLTKHDGDKAADTQPAEISPRKTRILEIGSYPYAHIQTFAAKWPGWEWWGSGRDDGQIAEIENSLGQDTPANLRRPVKLDIGHDAHWEALPDKLRLLGSRDCQELGFTGILMINIIHCCPRNLPEHVFRHATTTLALDGRKTEWIAAYGPWLNDDGSYKSAGDEQFDREYIRANHPSLGLRSIDSVDEMAQRWGYEKAQRKEMPRGNVWVVWRARA